jgi:hypothetical protein
MIVRCPPRSAPQQRYDHRLRDLVQRTGALTIAAELGVPRSTARGWLRAAPTVVVSREVTDLTEPELRQEILKLQRRREARGAAPADLKSRAAAARRARVEANRSASCKTCPSLSVAA